MTIKKFITIYKKNDDGTFTKDLYINENLICYIDAKQIYKCEDEHHKQCCLKCGYILKPNTNSLSGYIDKSDFEEHNSVANDFNTINVHKTGY